ncbi:MAG: transcriptional regulator with XRE-family HTH domain [Alteromonadaceae bacterium]|jgi:transcriptional regulator with XRE-family HTH domain
MKLGEKIKQLRNNAGLTQPELAAKANIEQSYLSKLENDKGSPSFEVLEKITNALNFEVMAFIESLDSHYVRDNLAHLPEVAEKYTEMRIAKQQTLKKRYIIAALMIILGIALAFMGGSKALFPDSIYEYKSMGVINKGEQLEHYTIHQISIIAETGEERQTRLIDNRLRRNEIYLMSDKYLGENFIEHLADGKRRFYDLKEESNRDSALNSWLIMLGFILMLGGGFTMNYVYQFKE